MSQEPVLSTLDQGVLLIELNRPERMNAFTEESHLRLREILARAAEDHAVRAVLLTGRGKGFCAGQDLNNRDPRQPGPRSDLGQSLGQFYNPTIRALRGLQKPVICAMNGAAAGAGVGLTLACDIVIAGESARFVLSFSRLGLVPDAGSSWCLTRLLGEARAKALLLTGETIPAPRAAELGLISKSVPDAELADEARALAGKLAAGPTLGLGLMKTLIQEAGGRDFDSQLEAERLAQQSAGFSDDYAEGVTAFLEKRPALFRGS